MIYSIRNTYNEPLFPLDLAHRIIVKSEGGITFTLLSTLPQELYMIFQQETIGLPVNTQTSQAGKQVKYDYTGTGTKITLIYLEQIARLRALQITQGAVQSITCSDDFQWVNKEGARIEVGSFEETNRETFLEELLNNSQSGFSKRYLSLGGSTPIEATEDEKPTLQALITHGWSVNFTYLTEEANT